MTNRNRRQLARVRNAFLGATALAGFAALATPASAVVINDSLTPTQAVDTAGGVNGVGQMVVDEQNGFIGLCTVSLINPRTVIFASHCVNENPAGNAFEPATGYGAGNSGLPIGFFFNVNNNAAGASAIGHWLNGVSGGPKDLTRTAEFAYNSNFVVYNTNCCTIGLGNNFLQSDVAMAALDTPAVGIPTYTLLFSALSAPVHATITGYGDNGTGTTGQGTIDFKRRIAENIVSVLGSLDDQDTFLFGAPDGLPANLYMIDFNDPKFNTAQANVFDFNVFHDTAVLPSATGNGEGITAPGDSGGPLIIDHAFAAPTIAAVLSGGDRFFNAQKGASYGTTSFYQPLYLYWDWILANNPYKYVTSTAGAHNWRDASAFVMSLDPAYMTIDGSGNLVNALPTTAAKGATNVPPGFGLVCYFDDCINIKTGVHTNPTPAPGPNPTVAHAPGSGPFGGMLGGQAGFDAFVASFIGSQGTTATSVVSGGPDYVSTSTIGSDNNAAAADGSVLTADATGSTPGSSSLTPSAQSNWINPEGTAQVGTVATGELVQGAPGATPGQIVQDTNANVATLAPARYYDVTIAAAGTVTQDTGSITVDKVTVFGASANLVVSAGATLNTLINYNSFAGNSFINGTLNSTGSVSMFGGVLAGTGVVNAPSVDFLIGAVAPGTNGSIGTLHINGTTNLNIGSSTLIDINTASSDVLAVTNANVAGSVFFHELQGAEVHDSHVFMTASGTITGSFIVPDSIPGVLIPVVTKTTVAGVQEEIVSFQAGSFVTLLNGTGTADQTTIAGALDTARTTGHYNDLLPLFLAIDPLSGATLGQALEDLAPDSERAAPLVGELEANAFDNTLVRHLGGIGAGAAGYGQSAGLDIDADGLKSAMNSARGVSAQSQQFMALGANIATNPGGGNDAVQTTGTAAAPTAASGGWMDLPGGMGGFISGSSLDGTVAIGGGGGKADVRGMLIAGGLDMPVGDGFTVGASFGYSDATSTLRAMPASLQSDSIQVAAYARYDWGSNWFAEGFASYGHQTIETRRVAIVGLSTFAVTGHSGGSTPSLGAFIGKAFHFDAFTGDVRFVPSVGVQYVNSGIDGFTETGVTAMTFGDFSTSTTLAKIGFDSSTTFDIFNVKFKPNLHLFFVGQLGGNAGTISSVFAAAPGAVMTFALAPQLDRSYTEFGFGTDFDLGQFLGTDATLTARYDGTSGRRDINYGAWTGSLSIKF
jgi:uncharacterized protein with beta-barrel porin domain